MALTITQKDANTYNGNVGAYDPAIYIALETAIGQYKFSYWVEVKVWNYQTNGYGNVIARYSADKNADDCGVFDVAPMVRAYMDLVFHNTNDVSTAYATTSPTYLFQFTFGSRQAPSATEPAVDNASTQVENAHFINGTLRPRRDGYNSQSMVKYGVDVSAGGTIGQTSRQGLTVYGGRETTSTITIPVRDDQYGYITMPFGRPNGQLYSPVIMVTVYLADGTSTDYSVINALPTTGRISIDVMCYPAVIDQVIGVALPATWTRYTVAMAQNSSPDYRVMKYHTFTRIENQCQADTLISFAWLNEVGGFDFITFTGRIRKSVEIDRQNWTRVQGNWWSADGSVTRWEVDSQDPSRMNAPVTIGEKYECHTGILQEVQNVAVESLMRSRRVFATDYRDRNNDLFYPALITSNSFRELTRDNDKIIEYTFEFEYSNQESVPTL
jgi:hypothetical protein